MKYVLVVEEGSTDPTPVAVVAGEGGFLQLVDSDALGHEEEPEKEEEEGGF